MYPAAQLILVVKEYHSVSLLIADRSIATNVPSTTHLIIPNILQYVTI